jgi:hypothetical protein
MLEEKIKLEKKTYDTVMAMLESPDEENVVVAFECIKNADFKTNIVYILLLYKEVNIDNTVWKKHAPEIFETIDKLLTNETFLSFRDIMEIARKYEVSQEDIQFYMDRYAMFLMRDLNKGKEYVELLEIKIKLKENESEES